MLVEMRRYWRLVATVLWATMSGAAAGARLNTNPEMVKVLRLGKLEKIERDAWYIFAKLGLQYERPCVDPQRRQAGCACYSTRLASVRHRRST